MIKGIDVSGWNPSTFPTSGLDFVVVKATEGTGYVNPHMGRQAATARTAGLALGFYHFLQPGDVEAQAKFFVEKCASMAGDFLVCDWETTGAGKRPSNADKDAFLKAVKERRPGHRVGLYCNRDYWLNRDATSYAADFLWIADPTTAGKPRIKAKWLFHQHSTAGGTDRNVAAFDTRAKLKAWCGYPSTAPKPTPPKAPAPAPTKDQQQDARLAKLEHEVDALQGE
jgi:GH25 family lysozyme M1 (1,4-beta-N-acetylmuramidase)